MTGSHFKLVGFASGIAGVDINTRKGPMVMRESSFLREKINNGFSFEWDSVISAPEVIGDRVLELSQTCTALARNVSHLMRQNEKFCVIGGDHSCAIGTWSGVYDAVHEKGEMGLIWIDAHMDSHTPETSETGRIHGMPLACLLGEGYDTLKNLMHAAPKLKPENVCLIGVRSYENGEAKLLQRHGVKVYFMNEVQERGFVSVLKEAMQSVSKKTVGYGISLDLDGIDPKEAPAVDVPEPNGISVEDIMKGLAMVASDPNLMATEIVEFDPTRDREHITEQLIANILQVLYTGVMKK